MSKRILVVVSDSDIQRFIKTVLESFGYSVDTADNGRAALLQLERSTYSGILIDPMLPVINGLEVLQQARELCPVLPVVMMTGTSRKEIIDQVIAEGAKEVLLYPFEKEHLHQVVKRWFGAASGDSGNVQNGGSQP
jgi:CheY-like chemotaxis protein